MRLAEAATAIINSLATLVHVGLTGDRLAPRGFRVPLQGASVHTEFWSSGEYLRGGRVHQPKAPEETGRKSCSMWLLAW